MKHEKGRTVEEQEAPVSDAEAEGPTAEEAAGTDPQARVDRVLRIGVGLAVAAVLVAAGLIGWSVFGPKPAPRTEAERLMQQGLAAVASDPASSTAHITLGSAYFETGQYGSAEAEFKTAMTLAKGSPVPLYDLAHVYRLTGRHAEAAAAFAEVVSAPERERAKLPDNMFSDARYWLGVEYIQLKRADDAIKALLPLVQRSKDLPLDAEAAKALAKAYEASGDTESAATWLQAVLKVQPHDAEAAAALKRLGR